MRPLLVNIESEGKKWRALADALAHRLRDDESFAEYANDFEVYLADDDDKSVLERVRDAGVPEEALEDVKDSFQQSMTNEQPEEGTKPRSKDFLPERHDTPSVAPDASDPTGQTLEDAGDTEQRTTNYQSHEAIQPTSRDGDKTTQSTDRNELGTSRSTPRSSGGNGQSRVGPQRLNGEPRSDDLRPESGREAERWLEEQLREQWINDVNKIDEGRDFTLSVGGQTVHIEAKHVKKPPGAIYWSKRQYELAEATSTDRNSYFIAVLSPSRGDANQYDIHWIWEPLERMKDMARKVTWSGKSEPKQLQTGDWNMADTRPPNVSPEKYEIEVKLTDDVFGEENRDGPHLEKLKAKIQPSRSSRHEAPNAPSLQQTRAM